MITYSEEPPAFFWQIRGAQSDVLYAKHSPLHLLENGPAE